MQIKNLFSKLHTCYNYTIPRLAIGNDCVFNWEAEVDFTRESDRWTRFTTNSTSESLEMMLPDGVKYKNNAISKNVVTKLAKCFNLLGVLTSADISKSPDTSINAGAYVMTLNFCLDGTNIKLYSQRKLNNKIDSIYLGRSSEFIPKIIFNESFVVMSDKIIVTGEENVSYVITAGGVITHLDDGMPGAQEKGVGPMLLANMSLMHKIARNRYSVPLQSAVYTARDALFAEAQYGPIFRDTRSKLTIEVMLDKLNKMNNMAMNLFGEVEIIKPMLVTVPN